MKTSSTSAIAGKRQLSLIAYYGPKDNESSAFWDRIGNLQKLLHAELGKDFQPYENRQIHGTIVGLEAAHVNSELIARNFLELEARVVALDLEGLLRYLAKTPLLPLDIRLGGFQDKDYPFTSRGQRPFQRSFTIHGATMVVMGWPFLQDLYSPALDSLRRTLGTYGALHKYHTAPNAVDNDFFLVLGHMDRPVEQDKMRSLADYVKSEIARWKDNKLRISQDHIRVVAYTDTKLKNKPLTFSISEALDNIKVLLDAYPQYEEAIHSKEWLPH